MERAQKLTATPWAEEQATIMLMTREGRNLIVVSDSKKSMCRRSVRFIMTTFWEALICSFGQVTFGYGTGSV